MCSFQVSFWGFEGVGSRLVHLQLKVWHPLGPSLACYGAFTQDFEDLRV